MSQLADQLLAAAPPTPADIAVYFLRRRSSIAEITPADLLHNERLWAEICGMGIAGQGGLLTVAQPPSPQEIEAIPKQHREHRKTYRSTGVCETCETEFEQPRGPSSQHCPACRKIARREAARVHMRQVRDGLAA